MSLSISLHLFGITMWLGSILIMTRLLKGYSEPGQPGEPIRAIIRRTWLGFGLGGCALVILTGLIQLFIGGARMYLAQPWFTHGKLSFVLMLIVVTVFVHLSVLDAAAGRPVSKKRAAILHGLSSLALLVIVFLTVTNGPLGK